MIKFERKTPTELIYYRNHEKYIIVKNGGKTDKI